MGQARAPCTWSRASLGLRLRGPGINSKMDRRRGGRRRPVRTAWLPGQRRGEKGRNGDGAVGAPHPPRPPWRRGRGRGCGARGPVWLTTDGAGKQNNSWQELAGLVNGLAQLVHRISRPPAERPGNPKAQSGGRLRGGAAVRPSEGTTDYRPGLLRFTETPRPQSAPSALLSSCW